MKLTLKNYILSFLIAIIILGTFWALQSYASGIIFSRSIIHNSDANATIDVGLHLGVEPINFLDNVHGLLLEDSAQTDRLSVYGNATVYGLNDDDDITGQLLIGSNPTGTERVIVDGTVRATSLSANSRVCADSDGVLYTVGMLAPC